MTPTEKAADDAWWAQWRAGIDQFDKHLARREAERAIAPLPEKEPVSALADRGRRPRAAAPSRTSARRLVGKPKRRGSVRG